MYFNVSQLTPCVLIIISVKMTNNYQRLYTKMNFRLSKHFLGETVTAILDFVKTIVIMPSFHTRHKTGNSSGRVLKISVLSLQLSPLPTHHVSSGRPH